MRAVETTLRAPRFNNVGSQVTVVQVQNTTDGAVEATLWFWGADGSPLANHPLTLAPFGSTTVNTSALPGLAGQGGSLTVSSNATYGGLAGKSVALEPATGLAFDTVLEPRPR